MPSAEEIADITQAGADLARKLGLDPHAALLAYSSFGYPEGERSTFMREAVDILDKRNVDFEYDGEMAADVALNPEYKELYPFAKIVGKANILIMPGQHSAAITYKTMKTLGGAKVIGPLLVGLGQAIEIAPLRSSTSETSFILFLPLRLFKSSFCPASLFGDCSHSAASWAICSG